MSEPSSLPLRNGDFIWAQPLRVNETLMKTQDQAVEKHGHKRQLFFHMKCQYWLTFRDTEINQVQGEWLTTHINLWYGYFWLAIPKLKGNICTCFTTLFYRNTSLLLPSLAVLNSTWKVPFDNSSFLSFPCSCKRFCRCCRELDSPATKPLKWLFPSLQLTVPSFPLALWKTEKWLSKVMLLVACRTKSKGHSKPTKHLQGLHKLLENNSCSCAAFRPSMYVQGRKRHLIFQVQAKAWGSSLETEQLSVDNYLVICWFFLPQQHTASLHWRSPNWMGWSGWALFTLGEKRGQKASPGLKRMCCTPLIAGHITNEKNKTPPNRVWKCSEATWSKITQLSEVAAVWTLEDKTFISKPVHHYALINYWKISY